MTEKEQTPLEKLPVEVQSKVAQLKEKGNKVMLTKVGNIEYVYFGLLREDWSDARAKQLIEGQKFAQEHQGKTDNEEAATFIVAKLEDMEEDFLIRYAVIYPVLTTEMIGKMSLGHASRLRDLIMFASGQNEEISEPVQL